MDEKKRGRMLQERTDTPIEERFVSVSNALTRGAQGLSLSETRIIALALAKTDSVPAKDLILSQRNGWQVRLTAGEYAETYDVDLNTAYEQLKYSARALQKRTWKTSTEGKRGAVIREGNWVSVIEYSEGEGRVDVQFTAEVAPHVLALRTQFTTYKLKQAAALRSVYAWRLFECLQSWRSKGRWTVPIEEFSKAMDAPASCRKDFGNLRMRVIEPAVNEIRLKNSLVLDWEAERAGRKVVGLVFRFSPDPQGQLDL
jgi:plasmid replication initiation protein